MAYDIRDSSSLELLRDYVQGVIAGLEAHDGLAALAEGWRAIDGRLRAARDERDEARFARIRATKRYHVLRADLLDALTVLSGEAYHLAGKDADRAPYAPLFRGRTVASLRDLGYNNLRDKVDTILAASAEAEGSLGRELGAVRGAYDRFIPAGEARKGARLGLVTHENKRAAFVLEIEDLGDVTEAKILGAFPGRTDLVRATLSPSLDGPGDKKEDVEPAPGA